jgi:hypothetical protein
MASPYRLGLALPAILVSLAGMVGNASAAPLPITPVQVLAVDTVGQTPDLPPAADILSVVLHLDGKGQHWLRVGMLSLARDAATAQALGRDLTAREEIPCAIWAGDQLLDQFLLKAEGAAFTPTATRGTTIRQDDGLWLPLAADLLTDASPIHPLRFTITTLPDETVTAAYWPGRTRDIQANCALVVHGNQGLGYTDVFHGRSDDLAGSGFDEALEIHESLAVPINVHLSGTLITAADWAFNQGDPLDFNSWLADGAAAGWVGMLTSAYAQHIMPFVHDDMNNWAVHTETQMVSQRFGDAPTVAWVPERVWLNTEGYPSAGVSDWIGDNWQLHGVGAVILDDDVHLQGHDNHQIHTLDRNGLRLIPRDRAFTGHIIGGNGQAALGILTAMASSGVGQYRIAVMAEDWEAVAEMGGWASDTPNAHETYNWIVDKCAQESAWLATWKLADAVANPDFTGQTFAPTPGTYWEIGGTDGYGGSNNSWYTHWAGWVPYVTGGDGNGECAGTGGNCHDYGTLWTQAYNALMAAPDNNISQAGWYVLMTNLYETGWHDGLGGPISGWQHNFAGHIKQALIYAEAARWADDQFTAATAAYFSDIDQDGYDEAILHSDRLFAVFEATGGRCTHLFVKGSGFEDTAIGVDNAYWSGTTADFNDDNHVGAFSDVGPNYQHQPYELEILDDDASDDGVTLRATYSEVSKEISLRTGDPWLEAVYRVGATPHWVQSGWSPSLVDLVWNADMQRVWSGFSYAYMGQHNPHTGLTVGWVLGDGGAGHQRDFSGTLMKGDEIISHGTFQVRLYAGPTSAPVDSQVPELQACATALHDTIGPGIAWATWNPAGQMRLFFDQIIDESTMDVTRLGFDDDGDGIPEVECDNIAYPAPIGSVWYVLLSFDPAALDQINALDQDNLRVVLEPGGIEDDEGNPNLWTAGEVIVYENLAVSIDGSFDADEWYGPVLDDENDSAWTSDNEIERVRVLWDELYLYVGIEGIVHSNSWILYLDTDPDGELGETDLTQLDVWERGAIFTAPGFRADWMYAAYQHQGPDDAHSFWDIESSTHARNRTSNLTMAFDPDHLNGLNGGSEIAIPWDLLYGMGDNRVPPGARISLVAALCWDPEPDGVLGGDVVPNGLGATLPVIDNVWTVNLDEDGDGVPDHLAISAVDSKPSVARLTLNRLTPRTGEDIFAYSIPGGGEIRVALEIFDLRGRLVCTLLDEIVAAGEGRLTWNHEDQNGRRVASGVYLARLRAGQEAVTRKVVLIK